MFIPKFYDGRNRTFFMGAYEGVRGEAITSPFALGADGADASGELLGGHARRSATRSPDSRFPATSFRPSQLSPTSLALLQYYPEANLPGTTNNLQAPSAATDNVDQVLGRVDQNLGNKVRFNLRYNWHDSFGSNVFNAAIPATAVTQPRVNNNWLFGYTHTLKPNLHNDFRIGYHRIDFDTLNPFAVGGDPGRRFRAGHSRASTATSSTTIPACRA